MLRLIFIAMAALFVADTTGLLPEGDNTACSDDADGKQCPPSCPTCTCTCAGHSLKTAPTVFELQPIDLMSLALELPPPNDARGQMAPQPITRPPIV